MLVLGYFFFCCCLSSPVWLIAAVVISVFLFFFYVFLYDMGTGSDLSEIKEMAFHPEDMSINILIPFLSYLLQRLWGEEVKGGGKWLNDVETADFRHWEKKASLILMDMITASCKNDDNNDVGLHFLSYLRADPHFPVGLTHMFFSFCATLSATCTCKVYRSNGDLKSHFNGQPKQEV